MQSLIMSYLTTLLECATAIFIAKRYLSAKFSLNVFEILTVAVTAVLANTIFEYNVMMLFIIGQLMIFCIAVANTGSIKSGLCLYMLTFITQFVSQIIASIPVSVLNMMFPESDWLNPLANLCTLLIAVGLLFTPLKKLFARIMSTTFTYKVSLTSSHLVLIALLIIGQDNLNYLYSNVVLFVILVVIVIICNILLLFYEKKLSVNKMRLEYYIKYLPIYENLINDIRANQHEFTNRLQALQILCDTNDLNEEFSKKLHSYMDTFSKPFHAYPLLMLQSPLFVASMYSLYLNGEAEGIAITFDVSCKTLESRISEILLADLASILLQNAIEASKSGDNIYVKIFSENAKTTVEVRNLVPRYINDAEITDFFSNSYSTKNKGADKQHGYGLYFLHKQVISNKGEVFATCVTSNDRNWLIFRFTV